MVPSHETLSSEILRAARILHSMEQAHASERGAIGLALEGGGQEMIDAPMVKQVGGLHFRLIIGWY